MQVKTVHIVWKCIEAVILQLSDREGPLTYLRSRVPPSLNPAVDPSLDVNVRMCAVAVVLCWQRRAEMISAWTAVPFRTPPSTQPRLTTSRASVRKIPGRYIFHFALPRLAFLQLLPLQTHIPREAKKTWARCRVNRPFTMHVYRSSNATSLRCRYVTSSTAPLQTYSAPAIDFHRPDGVAVRSSYNHIYTIPRCARWNCRPSASEMCNFPPQNHLVTLWSAATSAPMSARLLWFAEWLLSSSTNVSSKFSCVPLKRN